MDDEVRKNEAHIHIHPLTRVIADVVCIFSAIGFQVAEGPELETEENNFDMLNVPKDHPARDMHDTFWIKNIPHTVLRTHISAHQVPFMKEHTPPFRMISPGRVFRYEATDATHEAQFTYTEGLAVDKNLTVSDLKGTLEYFLKKIFETDHITTRLRPSYFPFVEPGFEVDVSCYKCGGNGCGLCKQTGWIEILGAGMVHPNVLSNAGIDPRKWKGFAFGGGMDRIAILKYEIDDIRLFYSGDLRFINQF